MTPAFFWRSAVLALGFEPSTAMNRQLEIFATAAALIATLVGATVTIENRYAKAVDVEAKLNQLYSKQLKTRILELQLKPAENFTPADRAMLMHLQQELKEVTE